MVWNCSVGGDRTSPAQGGNSLCNSNWSDKTDAGQLSIQMS